MLYLLLIAGTVLISLVAHAHVQRTYARYSQVPASCGVTGAEAAAAILARAGIHDVELAEIEQTLGDHYDPTHRRLVLSTENFHGRSLAALGVAAHECGHAIQHQVAYAPLHLRMAAVGAVQFVNPLMSIIPILGLVLHLNFRSVFLVMAFCMGLVMLFNLITLPVEFDASNRAKQILGGMGFIATEEEREGVRRTLDAAGWTYVAAFVISLASFLYYLLPLLTGSRRD